MLRLESRIGAVNGYKSHVCLTKSVNPSRESSFDFAPCYSFLTPGQNYGFAFQNHVEFDIFNLHNILFSVNDRTMFFVYGFCRLPGPHMKMCLSLLYIVYCIGVFYYGCSFWFFLTFRYWCCFSSQAAQNAHEENVALQLVRFFSCKVLHCFGHNNRACFKCWLKCTIDNPSQQHSTFNPH